MAVCKQCSERLILEVEDEDDPETIKELPDDLELPCGCHFHWYVAARRRRRRHGGGGRTLETRIPPVPGG